MATVDPAGTVRDIVDAGLYLVLGTAGETGRPWASPVYFAHSGYTEFFWVSAPEALHSRNIAVRPQVSIVIFNSQVPIGTGQGAYLDADAGEVTGGGLDRALGIFSDRSLAHGGTAWTRKDVQVGGGLRMYRAAAHRHWILAKDGRPDHRVAVQLGSRTA